MPSTVRSFGKILWFVRSRFAQPKVVFSLSDSSSDAHHPTETHAGVGWHHRPLKDTHTWYSPGLQT